METKAKKRLMNGIMVVLILIIAASGLFAVGKIQGWFGGEETAVMVSKKVKGVANIERNGIGYTLNSDVAIKDGDILETKKGAEADFLLLDENLISLSGSTVAKLLESTAEKVEMEVEMAEVFYDTLAYTKPLNVFFGGNQAMLSEAVCSVSVQAGSSALNVYAGDVSVTLRDGTQERVEAGEYLSSVEDEDGNVTNSVEDLQIASLNEFQIKKLQNCSSADDLCFTSAELQTVLDSREAEKQAALEASLNAQHITNEAADEEADGAQADVNIENEGSAGTDGSDAASEGSGVASQANGSSVAEYVPESQGGTSSNETVQEETSAAKVCTITILCDTILDNMDNLDAGKEVYVPANGTILATSSVEFEEGETVFDVLTRVCEYAGIQLEYSWTAIYDSYYVEGINNLYEFDCGNESGWMYKVNGWFPNYGCSSYYLEDGDNIVWCYTCNGLGADVGAAAY